MATSSLFSVSDPVELLALWRLVAEAKFQLSPEDNDLWGSPYVNALSQRLADALLAVEKSRGDDEAVARHQKWIGSLQNNAALPAVKARLKQDASETWWREKSTEQRNLYVRECIAPFVVDQVFLEELIRDAEA